ncbi:hypothetical protein HJB67_10305 [Rhizobium lentis]|uniref:hypothetical protein n=1 Tax=Rhizobium lentis TaxID=1138194 RepID=UPI001C83E65E|nr:hypothetical protein [Rhizobium lentis]MBX5010362.1 hypothetical protein [Rhizobium lentis]
MSNLQAHNMGKRRSQSGDPRATTLGTTNMTLRFSWRHFSPKALLTAAGMLSRPGSAGQRSLVPGLQLCP